MTRRHRRIAGTIYGVTTLFPTRRALYEAKLEEALQTGRLEQAASWRRALEQVDAKAQKTSEAAQRRREADGDAPAWAQQLIAEVCRQAGIKQPGVIWHFRSRAWSSGRCSYSGSQVTMDAGSDEKRARVVLLHELAHAWMRVTGMPGVGGGVGALTPAQHEEARRLVAAGYTKASVARVLGVSRQAIGQLIKRIEEK